MRKQIASFLLIAAVVVWGIWCGGQYFNEARVIPKRLSNPPDSVIAYNAIPTDGELPFFFPLNPLFFLVSLAAAIAAFVLGLKTRPEHRKWRMVSTILALVITIFTFAWFIPNIITLTGEGVTKLSGEQIISLTNWWVRLNWERAILYLAAWIAGIYALTIPPYKEIEI